MFAAIDSLLLYYFLSEYIIIIVKMHKKSLKIGILFLH